MIEINDFSIEKKGALWAVRKKGETCEFWFADMVEAMTFAESGGIKNEDNL